MSCLQITGSQNIIDSSGELIFFLQGRQLAIFVNQSMTTNIPGYLEAVA